MIRINHSLMIDDKDIEWQFVRASGPGGQNVNKVATAVQLRFNLTNASYLPERIRFRLNVLARNRISKEGILFIDADSYRTQERNKQDALERLTTLLREAAIVPKQRIATKPSKAAKARRIEAKKHTGQIKNLRRKPNDDH